MMKVFSDNIIFVDTEFSTNDLAVGQLLSVGMVKMNGEELYLELEFEGETSEFVKSHILPTLTQKKLTKEEARERILKFVGDSRPFMMGKVIYFDASYWSKYFFDKNNPKELIPPFFWIPIDFTALLFANGMDPESLSISKGKAQELCSRVGIDISKFHIHNALDDAKLLREIYIKLFS